MEIIKRRAAPGLSREGKTHKMTQKTHKNVLIHMVPNSRQKENKRYLCQSSTDILTPVQSYLRAQMNYSDSIFPS